MSALGQHLYVSITGAHIGFNEFMQMPRSQRLKYVELVRLYNEMQEEQRNS